MEPSRAIEKTIGPESLKNPATYLHAALRAFVSSAYDRIDKLLRVEGVFNFGPNTPYPDLSTLHTKLKHAVDEWRDKNAFIAKLIELTLANSRREHSDTTKQAQIVRDVFLPLTNYFFCYIKVERRRRPVPTVRVLFPVDFNCEECPLGPTPVPACANSCFQFTFFPHKPDQLLNEYHGHYQAAQFALADASFAAATPDLKSGTVTKIPLAALMVPLLLGQPLLLTDATANREVYSVNFGAFELEVRCRFQSMNHDLGLCSEAFVPIRVARSFMPGFYGGSNRPAKTNSREEWVPGFENSCPFCIELYSPMPDWFAHENDGTSEDYLPGEYSFQKSESDKVDYDDKPPTPHIFSTHYRSRKKPEPTWTEIGKLLALGFNLQHYSELMATGFVEWLRDMFTDSSHDPFAPTLRRRYKEALRLDESASLPDDVETFLSFVTANPDLLADVLNKIHHGMLLEPSAAPNVKYDLSTIEGVKRLAKDVDGAVSVEALDYGEAPYCAQPLRMDKLKKVLEASNKKGVLTRLVAEVIKNHRREEQKKAILVHACLDPDQHRYSLHLCSPDVSPDLRTYLNLRQGLSHLRQDFQNQTDRVHHAGIGLALSRSIAETSGFDYVLGLGRDRVTTPAVSSLDIKAYRKDLYTRIYFGGSL